MPTVPVAVERFVAAGVLFAPSKAANAGGVAVSGLEMAQNMQLTQWSSEEVDRKLQQIIERIHGTVRRTAAEYGNPGTTSSGPTSPDSSRSPTPCSTRARSEMTTTDAPPVAGGHPAEESVDKGLKSNALSLVSNIVIGVASTAPAYSLAATLGLIAVAVGVLSPMIVVLAFIPMLFVSIGYSELNKVDPDCGTTFTWGTRTFNPWVGWLGGWGIIASDVLVMASLAQVTGQYTFLLFGADGIGNNPTSEWVLLVGVLFIAVLTYVCYRGIELSARVQRDPAERRGGHLVVFAVVALVRVAIGHAPASHLTPSWEWFNPFHGPSFSKVIGGLLLMLFIYWGWDTSVSINEETEDRTRNPGLAAIISTVLLLIMYFVVTLAAQAFAGVGTSGIGLANPGQLRQHLLGAGPRGVRQCVDRHPGRPPADPHDHHLGHRLDPDDHPAHGSHHPVHGGLQVHPRRLRARAQALPHPDRLDGDHGRRSPSCSTSPSTTWPVAT